MTQTIIINTSEIPGEVAESLFRNFYRAINTMRTNPKYKDIYEQYLKEEMEKCQRKPITA